MSGPRRMAVEPRLWPRIDASGGCWLWTGGLTSEGYGKISIVSNMALVHRVVWELLVGPIPAGMQIDHLCRVRRCANPDHLQVVTPRENTRRGMAPIARTWRHNRCQRGHDMARAYVDPQGGRHCKVCRDLREVGYVRKPRVPALARIAAS